MNRRLRTPTAADVSDEATWELGDKKLCAWLEQIRVGDRDAIGALQQLVDEDGAADWCETERAMRAQCETDALDEILADMQYALDGYVCSLIEA